MKIFSILTFLISSSIHSYSQDRVVLKNDSVILGRITTADSSHVEIRKTTRPDGPDYIFRRREIKKLEYENGQAVFYPHSFTELSLGISTSLVYFKDENTKYQGIHHFDNKSIGISFIMRVRVISLRIESGYAQLYRQTTYVDDNVHNPNVIYTYDTLNADMYFGFISFRTNFSRGNINPYLFIAIGLDQYKVNSDIIISENIRIGTGAQFKIKNKFYIEGEFGLNYWNENIGNQDENLGLQLFPYFGINFYWIAKTSYK